MHVTDKAGLCLFTAQTPGQRSPALLGDTRGDLSHPGPRGGCRLTASLQIAETEIKRKIISVEHKHSVRMCANIFQSTPQKVSIALGGTSADAITEKRG